MKKFILLLILLFGLPFVASAQVVGGTSVQTNQAINISNSQATLQGQINMPYFGGYNYVWFQWGQTNSYGNETGRFSQYGSGSFSQNISNLAANTTYHFRALAEVSGSLIYGQDITFYTGNGNYYGSGSLTVSKKVINYTSGNLTWFPSVNANPYDILGFAIILQANNQDVHNVVVSDSLSSYFMNQGSLMINTNQNPNGNITSGVNVGTVTVNQPIIVTYKVQVAPDINFAYGMTTISNSATVTSNETGTQTASASVIVNKSTVSGVTTISTGLTNKFTTDSFFLPLLLILTSLWLILSGRAAKLGDALKIKLKR